MRVISYCNGCLTGTAAEFPEAREIVCRQCGEKRNVVAERLQENMVKQCAMCGCGHLYVEKDFPAWLGGAIMLSGVVGFLVMTFHNILIAIGILLAVAALDFVAYQFAPWRTVCYRCLATYRGAERNPDHRAYELGLAGRYSDDYEKTREQMKS